MALVPERGQSALMSIEPLSLDRIRAAVKKKKKKKPPRYDFLPWPAPAPARSRNFEKETRHITQQ